MAGWAGLSGWLAGLAWLGLAGWLAWLAGCLAGWLAGWLVSLSLLDSLSLSL